MTRPILPVTLFTASLCIALQASAMSCAISKDGVVTCPDAATVEKWNTEQHAASPALRLDSPKATDVWYEGETYVIRWQSSGIESLWISAAMNGKDKGYLTSQKLNATTGSYTWTIPKGFATDFGPDAGKNSMFIHLRDTGDSGIEVGNEKPFSILAKADHGASSSRTGNYCYSSNDCPGSQVCSTEHGDCQSGCKEGSRPCIQVCAGVCEERWGGSSSSNACGSPPPSSHCADGSRASYTCEYSQSTYRWISNCSKTDSSAPSCEPYMCNDGSTFESCTSDGYVINYVVAPCQDHGGEVNPGLDDSGMMVDWDFWDVPDTTPPERHPYTDAILYLHDLGIVKGYADGSFRPDRTINRAEFAKILEGSIPDAEAGIELCPMVDEDFNNYSDVHGGDWFFDYVCMQTGRGLVKGYSDGTFRPDTPINFVEAAKMLDGSQHLDISGVWPPHETNVDPWFEPYVRNLSDKGAIPKSITRFDQLITRGEMAEMIWRLKENITDKPSQTYEEIRDAEQRYEDYLQNCRDRGFSGKCDVGGPIE